MKVDELTGRAAYDAEGEHIGKIEQTYEDERGAVRFVRVKFGTLLPKHRLVPADDVEQTDEGVALPYSKDAIENAPDLPEDVNPASGMVAEDLRSYYLGKESSTRE